MGVLSMTLLAPSASVDPTHAACVVCLAVCGVGRLHAKGYTLAHHLQSGSPGRSAHGGGTPGPGQPAVTRLSA